MSYMSRITDESQKEARHALDGRLVAVFPLLSSVSSRTASQRPVACIGTDVDWWHRRAQWVRVRKVRVGGDISRTLPGVICYIFRRSRPTIRGDGRPE